MGGEGGGLTGFAGSRASGSGDEPGGRRSPDSGANVGRRCRGLAGSAEHQGLPSEAPPLGRAPVSRTCGDRRHLRDRGHGFVLEGQIALAGRTTGT
jgi:hypothetical protein